MDLSPVRRTLRRLPGARRVVLTARFGNVRRTTPLTEWGTERGTPVDRWFISHYLQGHAAAVTGRVLEVKSDQYATALGATEVDVLDIDAANPLATVVGDLCNPTLLTPGTYDAAVVTQTLQLVSDPAAAVRHLLASLRPGGTLLLTVPCLSRLVDDSDRWRWTPHGFAQLLRVQSDAAATVEVRGLGHGLAARAFLFGLAAEDLSERVLAHPGDAVPLVVGAAVTVPAAR